MATVSLTAAIEEEGPQERRCSGSGSRAAGRPHRPGRLVASRKRCGCHRSFAGGPGSDVGCRDPPQSALLCSLKPFSTPISLREHLSSPLPFLKSLSTAQNLYTCLDMHVRSYKHAIRRADSVPLTNTPTRVHTLPHPLCDRRGRGLRRPLGGGQGVFIEAGSELMNFPGTRLLHPSGAKSGRPHGHPPGPEEGACRLCCQAGVGACECQLRGWGTLHLPAWPGAHSLLAWMPLPTRRNG